jgi:hypothetical protein
VAEAPPGRARHSRPSWWQAARWPGRGPSAAEATAAEATAAEATAEATAAGALLRVAGAVVVGVLAVVISGWSPGVAGLLVGLLTWLLLEARRALARRRAR